MEDAKRTFLAAALRAKEAELAAGLSRREGLELETEPDILDQIQSAADRALVIQALDRNSTLLQDIRAALQRIEDGSYGYCVRCDEAISQKRLAAAPWASRCLKCQELADREETEKRAQAYGKAASSESAFDRSMVISPAA